jgi:uncharacterized protein DUF6585
MILSPPRVVFGQTMVLRIVFGIVALFFAGIPFLIALGSNPDDFPGVPVGLAVLLAYGVLCFLISRTRLSIHPEGVQRSSVLGTKEMLWDEVTEYRYRIVPNQTGFAVGGLIGAAVQAAVEASQWKPAGPPSITLVARDGRKLRVTPNVKGSEEAIEMIVAEVHDRLKPELKRRLENNDEVAFGPLRLSSQGVAWRGKETIRLDEIDRVGIVGRKLRIRRKDKYFSTLAVPPEKIPNVLLAMELIEGLRAWAGASQIAATFS